jgi:hypothetical protein
LKSEEERGFMTETNESEQESEREEEELRAEEESAKAMEAEVPHPEGYTDGGQEPPA